MKILVIGGTRFLGRYITQEAVKRNHDITLFNRGQENRHLFPDMKTIIGDRTDDMERLGDQEWDCVIDTCGFVPWAVKPSIEFLKNLTNHYVFISSQSVYSDFSRKHVDEDSPVSMISAETVEACKQAGYGPYGEHYGAMKYLCEQLMEQNMPQKVLHVRAGIICGPHDYTDRLSYWIHRISQGEEVLAPGNPEQPIQLIDVRDLASWLLQMIEQQATGVFNVTGTQTTMEQVLNICRQISNSNATFQWVDEQFLLKEQVQPWTELPLWLPEKTALSAGEKPPIGFFQLSINRALKTGLSFRPLWETVEDTFQWLKEENKEYWKAGLPREKEKQLLYKFATEKKHG
jgi:2'-hydroxyisoflavone reductase